MRTGVLAAVIALAACPGDKEAKPKPSMVAVVPDAVPAPVAVPTGPPDARLPGRVVPLTEVPILIGPSPPEPPSEVHMIAVDLPIDVMMSGMIGPEEDGVIVEPSSDALIYGQGSAKTMARLIQELRSVRPDVIPVPVKPPEGSAVRVNLVFAGAPVRDLYRLLGDVERRSYVLEPGEISDALIIAKDAHADGIGELLATKLERVVEIHDRVAYVRRPDSPPLDRALIDRRGPVIDVDTHAAGAGEIYAAMAALGADVGGAACDQGPAIEVRVKQARAGLVAAAIAAVSGVPPGEVARCKLPAGDLAAVTVLRAVVSAKARRIALVGDRAAATLLDTRDVGADAVGPGYVTTSTRGTELWPNAGYTERDGWVWTPDRVRLMGVLIQGGRRHAYVELPDRSWVQLEQPLRVPIPFIDSVEIQPDRVRYTVSDGYGDPHATPPRTPRPPTDYELVLRER